MGLKSQPGFGTRDAMTQRPGLRKIPHRVADSGGVPAGKAPGRRLRRRVATPTLDTTKPYDVHFHTSSISM
jgi:hypothetical protein